MKIIKITEPWVPDQDTFKYIQEVQKFCNFLCNLTVTTKEQEEKLIEIKSILNSFKEPGIKKQFNTSLNVFHKNYNKRAEDWESSKDSNAYWRRWGVNFELNAMEIEMETEASGADAEIYEKEPFYSAAIYFEKKLMPRRVYWDTPFSEFLKDAIHYKKYQNETHNILEVDVDVW